MSATVRFGVGFLEPWQRGLSYQICMRKIGLFYLAKYVYYVVQQYAWCLAFSGARTSESMFRFRKHAKNRAPPDRVACKGKHR